MATSGKKTKKKPQTVSLDEFLTERDGAAVPKTTRKLNWATETDDADDDDYTSPYPKGSINRKELPTGPKSTLQTVIDLSRLPASPPFIAFLGNLPYEANEEDIIRFFKGLKIVGIRFGTRPGFAYAEFEDVNDLKTALQKNQQKLDGRDIKIDLADRGADKSDERREKPDNNWRANKSMSYERGYGSGGRRDNYGDSQEYYNDRNDYANDSFSSRPDYRRSESYGSYRDGGRSDRYNRENRYGGDRVDGGYRSDRYGNRDQYGSGGGGAWNRDARNAGRDDRYGGRDEKYNRDDRYGREDRRYGGADDRYRGYGNRGGGPGPRNDRDRYGENARSYPSGNPERSEAIRERPKLNLQPRTKPLNTDANEVSERAASIFGSAKPVDTAVREKEIEERLQRQQIHDAPSHSQNERQPRRDSVENAHKGEGRRSRTQSDDLEGSYQPEPRADNRRSSESDDPHVRRCSKNGYDGDPPAHPSVDSVKSQTVSVDTDVSSKEPPSQQKSSECASRTKPHRSTVSVSIDSSLDSTSIDPRSSSHRATASTSGSVDTSGKVEMIDAPPPKENFWQRRREGTQVTVSVKQTMKDDSDSPPDPASPVPRSSPPKPQSSASESSRRSTDSGVSRRRGNESNRGRGGRGGRGARRGGRDDRRSNDRPLPKSIDDMPKFDQASSKDWSDQNKFSFLDEDVRDGDNEEGSQ